MNQEYKSLSLTIVDRDKNPQGVGCGYYYLILSGGSSHTAFRTKTGLKGWLKLTGLKIGKRTWHRSVQLLGGYSRSLEMHNSIDFFNRYGGLEPFPALDNGSYSIGFKENTANGVVLHIQNPNTDRMELDYKITEGMLNGKSYHQAKYTSN